MIRDPGLQPERTALAWRRTSLAMAANAFLVVRSAMQTRKSTLLLLGIALGVAALALLAVGFHRRRQLSRSGAAPSARLIAFTPASTVFAACAGVLALLN